MPLFEFVCQKCGKRFEEIVTKGRGSIKCPDCSSEETEKQTNYKTTFVLKGGGWGKDLYSSSIGKKDGD